MTTAAPFTGDATIPAVAIVGMACRYPDARSPADLWNNVLAQRRAFRRIPPERIRLADYQSDDPEAPDSTYASHAAVIEGFTFDRARFGVAGSSFRAADLVHWLALDVADAALADAGYVGGTGLPRETTGVVLGNTLTGEFSRAGGLRWRWPYARRVVDAVLRDEGFSHERRQALLEVLESRYKAPFPPPDEESLAGGLSNTIAGRVCNHFDLNGGGYTVDGACASSLLAVSTACTALVAGDLDVALAGGVDLSLDPFELVGFARAGALARDEMRVYDVRATGFWPGEGCGVVVLMRHLDALAERRPVYALIRGWGVSSDGSGGLTRPEVGGQLLAIRRAYRRAAIDIGTVSYFEGHGTGTPVGDAAELAALSAALGESRMPPAAIGSVKANVGHTKAAAGIAGLIKATLALHTRVIPPTTACERPLPELANPEARLRVPSVPEPWPSELPLRAGVSAMGFGGINTHIVLDAGGSDGGTVLGSRERRLGASPQDAELFLFRGPSADDLLAQVAPLAAYAARLSRAELVDLAVELERRLDEGPVRAALIASTPEELAEKLGVLQRLVVGGVAARADTGAGVFLGSGTVAPRVGFLFPGQGSPANLGGGAWRRRFEFVHELYSTIGLAAFGKEIDTAVAQPAIITASLAGLAVLEKLGIEATVGSGHSLGEVTALHWGGAFGREALLRIVAARARAMADLGGSTGAMASIEGTTEEVRVLVAGQSVDIAAVNAPRQVVVSGEANAVNATIRLAEARGLRAGLLRVSHAFHSPLVAAAIPAFRRHLATEHFGSLQRNVISTVTGSPLTACDDLSSLLCRHVTSMVRFSDAVAVVLPDADLLIEVGSGHVLTGLVGESAHATVVALDAGGPSLRGLLLTAGVAFVMGAPINHRALFVDRFSRPFDLDWHPRFFDNPCERAPLPVDTEPAPADLQAEPVPCRAEPAPDRHASALTVVRELIAARTELRLESVRTESRLLADLHLNSIAVGQLLVEAARRFGVNAPLALTDWSHSTVGAVAAGLEDLRRHGGATGDSGPAGAPAGVATWIRAFTVEMVDRAPRRRRPPLPPGEPVGGWEVIGRAEHPLVRALEREAECTGGRGVIVCLPPDPTEADVGLLLTGYRTLRRREAHRFVIVQHGGSAGGFARTLHLEAPEVTACVVDIPLEHPEGPRWVMAEATTASGFVEAHYDISGRRREPTLRLLHFDAHTGSVADTLSPADVVLVTGGGKGIAAECALALARETGARLLLMGRSRPADDRELAINLDRISKAGVEFRYSAADVIDREAVEVVVRAAEADLGRVTAIVHGAGANVPRRLDELDETAALATLAPKVVGARNVLAAVDAQRLRLFVAFGSIIARTGLPGEADYALANARLAGIVERWQADHPHCRCLTIEWSVWSGIGMGERLGRVDQLARAGITPISPDEGVNVLRTLLTRRMPRSSVVVTGRFGDLATTCLDRPDLPFLRFLERPRVYYPGVELVADARLSLAADPYLDDHRFQGQPILPAVIGLEAMAQAVMAVTGTTRPPQFERVRFDRPITIPDGDSITIRSAALVDESGRVDVVLRTEETAFQVDHFRATCHVRAGEASSDIGDAGRDDLAEDLELAPAAGVDVVRTLYEATLFQRGRFRQLQRYRLVRSTESLVEIECGAAVGWFGPDLPGTLVRGDAGARDAILHGIQACIPHAVLLPIGIDLLVQFDPTAPGRWTARARERSREGGLFVYDVDVTGGDGRPVERWQGVRLRVAGEASPAGDWIAPLLGPYLERRAGELIPWAEMTVMVEQCDATSDDDAERHGRSRRALRRLLGGGTEILTRPDGKPEIRGTVGVGVSAAHAADLTLAVAGRGHVGCDVEWVQPRSAHDWSAMLGTDRWSLAQLAAQEHGEDLDTAATRVWAAVESLKKAGAVATVPMSLVASGVDGWTMFRAGSRIAVAVTLSFRGAPNRLAVALVAGSDETLCEPTSTDTWWDSRKPTSPVTSTM